MTSEKRGMKDGRAREAGDGAGMRFDDLMNHPADWLDGSGDLSPMVVSSRARLARNLHQERFPHRASEVEQARVIERVLGASRRSESLKEASFFETSQLEPMDRRLLVERHLISPALAERKGQGGILVSPGEGLSVMINEEDHIRLQVITSGSQPRKAWTLADRADDELSGSLDYAFSERLGYLTACPTNVGTGLRVSILIHLPGLVLTQDMERVVRGVTQMGFAVRGLYGEGTEVIGGLFQISNQVTLGRSEEEIVDGLENVSRQIVESEEIARETLIRDARSQIEDKVWRAYGILIHARLLTTQEFMNLSSAVRLGCSLGMIDSPDVRLLNELMVLTQPAHLQRTAGRSLKPDERDLLRAEFVRKRMSSLSNR